MPGARRSARNSSRPAGARLLLEAAPHEPRLDGFHRARRRAARRLHDTWPPELEHSGLDPTLTLGQLDPAQRAALCAWHLDLLGGAGHVESCTECSGGGCIDWTVTVNTQTMCTVQLDALAHCAVSVSAFEVCGNAQAQDLCGSPADCDALAACL